MFRFSIRDVLWLMVVVGLAVALWMEHRRLAVMRANLQVAQEELRAFRAEKAIADLRAKELRGGVILTPSPGAGIKALERRGFEMPRAKDE